MKNEIDCDWCNENFALSSLFNVSYLDEDGNENGYANVLCENCLEESKEIHGSRFVDAWQ